MKQQEEALRMAANYLEMIRKAEYYGSSSFYSNIHFKWYAIINRISPRYNYWLERAKL